MEKRVFLGIDMGASSGRHVAGIFDQQRITLEEVYRFENGPVHAAGRTHWDVLSQWTDIQTGLVAAAEKYGDRLASVGIDTWGVDFALLGHNDEILANPYHYRDGHTDGVMQQAFETVARDEIFQQTGLQFLQFNTLFQLIAMRQANSPLLDVATQLLMMPDLFHWLLTGEKANEFTDASTTQFYNPKTKDWSRDLLRKFDLPDAILGQIIQPGTSLGRLRRSVAETTGLPNINVVVPGTHDTASAVMSVPTDGQPGERPTWCYISSGTWSLMGVEVSEPVINEKCSELNFTNEGGVGGTVRLLKNIAGLWLIQECRRVWNLSGAEHRWHDLTEMADRATPLLSVIDPDDASFLAPLDMPAEICAFCRRTGQTVPVDEGAVIRCALESLALKYRQVLNWLQELIGGRIETIHIVGGGTQNRQLCQMTADACGRRVVAGPIEATAIGNIMMQAVASGDVGSIDQARDIIRHSFDVQEYLPHPIAAWDEAYSKFLAFSK